jgi:hypothetical protein
MKNIIFQVYDKIESILYLNSHYIKNMAHINKTFTTLFIMFMFIFMNTLCENSTEPITYDDEVTVGGMVDGSWSVGGSKRAYACSGIMGATDC